MDEHEADEKNRQLEDEADAFTQDYLIPAKELAAWSPDKYVSDADICMFARKIGIHPGLLPEGCKMKNYSSKPLYRIKEI